MYEVDRLLEPSRGGRGMVEDEGGIKLFLDLVNQSAVVFSILLETEIESAVPR